MQNLAQFLTMPKAALLLMLACLGSLVFALTMQYGFGVAPCELCLWQRVPFASVAALSLIGVVARPYGRHTRLLLGCCAALLLANAGLAVFHSGVERHWWEFHSSCTGPVLERANSIDDLRRALLDKPVVRCDQISWTLLGLSMANLNIAFSAILALFALVASRAGAKV